MQKRTIAVGAGNADLVGDSELAIQAAIDYLSHIGGGTVRIGAGEFTINSALHLRSGVDLEGTAGKTQLRKSGVTVSRLGCDADLHENRISLTDPEAFEPGQTVTVKVPGKEGFSEETVAIITGKEDNVCYLDRELYQTYLLSDDPIVETSFPVISGYGCSNVRIRNIAIDGNKRNNRFLGGCRGGGIYLFEASCVDIEECSVRGYNGDGISYQKCRDIAVRRCECVENEGKGIHPGSGTQRTVIDGCRVIGNALDGIFLCWRVTDSVVENCVSMHNKRSGLSIGHKDVRNVIRNNNLSENAYYGLFFRNEPDPMGANFNLVENNVLKDNGRNEPGSGMGYVGIRLRGSTNNNRFTGNRIEFEKAPLDRTIGICTEGHTYGNYFEGNQFINCKKEFHDHWLIEEENGGDCL